MGGGGGEGQRWLYKFTSYSAVCRQDNLGHISRADTGHGELFCCVAIAGHNRRWTDTVLLINTIGHADY
jgi:hypothetical protein